jgi:integrase
MSRVRDLWFAEVPVKDAGGKTVRRPDGRVLKEKHKTSKHPDRGGSKEAKRWLAVWADPDGKEVTKAYAKAADAKAYAKKMEGDADRGEYIAKDAGKEKFGELARKWIRLRKIGASARLRYESVLRNHIEPEFGRRSVRTIKPSEVAEWLVSPEISKLGDVMQEAAYFILTGTFELAVADSLRRDNPAKSKAVTPPKVADTVRDVWPVETVWRVIDAHPREYRAIPVLAAGMGLRQGCALGLADGDLEWPEDDENFERGKAQIRRQVVRVGSKYYFKLPKGGKERTVPVSRGVAAQLRAHMEKYPPVEVTLPWIDEKGSVAGEPVTARLIFTWQGSDLRTHGREIRANTYDNSVWNPALSRAGLAPEPARTASRGLRYTSGGRENGMHALRHFYSTALQDAGVPTIGVTDFMGHSRQRLPITFRVYGHVTEETFEQARAAIDRALFKLRPVEARGAVAEFRAAR